MGSGVVHQVRDILGLVTLHKTDLMVPPLALITNVVGLPVEDIFRLIYEI